LAGFGGFGHRDFARPARDWRELAGIGGFLKKLAPSAGAETAIQAHAPARGATKTILSDAPVRQAGVLRVQCHSPLSKLLIIARFT